MTGDNVAAFLVAFAGSVLMWWIYFDLGARRGAELIAHHAEPGRVARNAYTYLHMPIVAGIIVGAVADELLLAHPEGLAPRALVAFQCSGLALFLLGVGFFKRLANPYGTFPLSHLAGLCLLAPVALWAGLGQVPALAFAALTVLVLIIVRRMGMGLIPRRLARAPGKLAQALELEQPHRQSRGDERETLQGEHRQRTLGILGQPPGGEEEHARDLQQHQQLPQVRHGAFVFAGDTVLDDDVGRVGSR
jgi:hypothetical protein